MIRTKRIGLGSVHHSVPILGYSAEGTPIYGIAGGAGDDDQEEGDEDDDEDGDQSSDEEDEEDDEQGDDSSGDSGDQPLTRDEFQRMERRMRAADRRADKAQRELAQLKKGKGKGKDDEDNEEITELRAKAQRADELEEENVALSVRIAVLTRPEAGQFHDPEDILRFLDFHELTGVDGGIDGNAVSDALADLAEKKKHLVKAASNGSNDEEDDDGDEKKPPRQRSGRQTNSRKKKDKGLTQAALRNKYPALRQLG